MPDIFLNGKNFLILWKCWLIPHNICRYFVSRQEIRALKALLYKRVWSPSSRHSLLLLERPYNQLVRLKLWVHPEWCSLRNWFWKSCDEIVFPWIWPLPCSHHREPACFSWRHLEYYLLHCTPTDSQDSLFASRSLFKSRRLQGKLILKISEPQMPTDFSTFQN